MVVADPPRVELMAGAQTEFYLSEAYSPALIAGRGYGKTIALAAKAFKYADAHPGGRGVITQPTFEMIRRNFIPVWEQLFGHLGGKYWSYAIIQQGVPSEIRFANGFVYDLRPATNEMAEKFRGATYCGIFMDEIRNEDQLGCYLALTGALRMPGYPLQFCVTSTPEARRPWIRKIWTDHVDPISEDPLPPEEYPKFKARTEENWKISDVQKKRIRAMYGGASRYARQELDAEDIAQEGIAFEEFTEKHIGDPPPGLVFRRTLAGIDFGQASPTAMHEIKLDISDNVWITREFYMRNATDYDWIKSAAEWNIPLVICDPSRSEQELSEMRRKYGVRIQRARPPAKRFEDRVKLLRNRLMNRTDTGGVRLHISPSCPNLINEIQNLAYAQPRIGEYAIDRWETGSLDHGFDAVAYGLSEIDLPSYEYHPTGVNWFGRQMRPA